jgi:hypothetical protein
MIGNLADLAATGLASEPTLRKWIQAQPDQGWIIKRGSNGDAYEIDLLGAVDAFRAEEAAKLEQARRRAEDVRQLGMDLGLSGTAETSPGLSIAERKQLLEEELIAMKLAERRRELVSFAEVEAVVGDVLVRFRQRGSTFSARLAKIVDLTRDQITAIDRMVAADQDRLATEMENWGSNLGNGDDDAAAAVAHPAAQDRG